MLILAGVAVNIALDGDNIFVKANKAREDWNAKVAEEDDEINSLINILDNLGQPIPGLYSIDTGELMMSWGELIDEENQMLVVSNGTLSKSNFNKYESSQRFKLVVDKSVTLIENMQGLTQLSIVILPNTITKISSGAFSGCSSLESIEIPSGTIQSSIFSSGMGVKEIVIGDNVDILPSAFIPSYSIERLIIGDGVREIPNGFMTSQIAHLKELKLGKNIEIIGNSAFCYGSNSYIKKIVLPEKIKKIGDYAFAEFNAVEEVNLPEGLESIGTHAFEEWYSLKSIVLPSTLRELKSDAFIDCESLEEITILDGLTSIPENVFRGCRSMKKITIPVTVTEIGYESYFDGLTDVYYTGTVEDWGKINFQNNNVKNYLESATIHYEAE